MPGSPPCERLAQAVIARRRELDVSQLEVWQAGGPSNSTLTVIENGRLIELTRQTARKLDRGLQWEPGSARRLWEGGEPTPLLLEVRRDDSAYLREVIRQAYLNPSVKQELLDILDGHPGGA